MRCVSIRRYYRLKNSTKELPTRSGIALRLDDWEALSAKIDILHEKLSELKAAKPCHDRFNQTSNLNCREFCPYAFELYN